MRILVLQHVDVEHPGAFREFWSESGHTYDQIELDAGERIPDFDAYELMVVMGGPQDVWQEDIHPWLKAEKAAIRRWVHDLGKPYLGICLGHQLLAEALDGKVTPMARPEVGLADVELTASGLGDPVLAGFPGRIETFQWHGAEVSSLPDGAVVLASNAACQVQAMRWGRHAYGFQYHCEILGTTVDEWERIPAYRASLADALGAEEAARLGGIVARRLPAFHDAARKLNDNLLATLARAAGPVAFEPT